MEQTSNISRYNYLKPGCFILKQLNISGEYRFCEKLCLVFQSGMSKMLLMTEALILCCCMKNTKKYCSGYISLSSCIDFAAAHAWSLSPPIS